CDPSLTYDPGFRPPDKPGKDFVKASRRNFVELCIELTTDDEKAFEATWRLLGLSVDWSTLYQTISDRARAPPQRACLVHLSRAPSPRRTRGRASRWSAPSATSPT